MGAAKSVSERSDVYCFHKGVSNRETANQEFKPWILAALCGKKCHSNKVVVPAQIVCSLGAHEVCVQMEKMKSCALRFYLYRENRPVRIFSLFMQDALEPNLSELVASLSEKISKCPVRNIGGLYDGREHSLH